MRMGQGFTILELAIAVAIVGILATFSYASYEASWEKSNFRAMREFGVEFALKQQLHRQQFGRYAQRVDNKGLSSPDRLVMASAAEYQVNVSNADLRGYRAEIMPHAEDDRRLPSDCRVLLVESDTGSQRFKTRSSSNEISTKRCIPYG